MKAPEAVVGALIFDKEGKVILITSQKFKGMYVVPGGHVEEGEALHDAVVRECREETGLDVCDIEFVEIQEHPYSEKVNPDRHFICIDYVCKARPGEVKLDNAEATSFIKVTPEEALKLDNLGHATRKFIERYVKDMSSPGMRFDRLYGIEKRLRKECPWDREQTIKTMLKDFLDEAKEVEEAVEKNDYDNLEEEIGDVIQTLLLMVTIAEEERHFSASTILNRIIDKMIRRHPHVFGELRGKSLTKEEVLLNWKEIKKKEKSGKA